MKRESTGREVAALWLLGLFNNSIFVVLNASAQFISGMLRVVGSNNDLVGIVQWTRVLTRKENRNNIGGDLLTG